MCTPAKFSFGLPNDSVNCAGSDWQSCFLFTSCCIALQKGIYSEDCDLSAQMFLFEMEQHFQSYAIGVKLA